MSSWSIIGRMRRRSWGDGVDEGCGWEKKMINKDGDGGGGDLISAFVSKRFLRSEEEEGIH